MHAAALLVGLSVTGAPSRAPETATFRADLGHTAVYPSGAGLALSKVRWRFPTCGPVRGSPVTAGDTVLFGSGDGHLYALEAGSGRERWRASLGGAVASPSTGAVRWRFEAGPGLPFAWGWDFWLSSPAVSNGRAYVGSGDGRIDALDARTGRILGRGASILSRGRGRRGLRRQHSRPLLGPGGSRTPRVAGSQ